MAEVKERSLEARLTSLVAPVLADLGVRLEDVHWGGGRLRVVVDTPDGIDSETLVLASRTVSAELDTADPIASAYTLEVTSPGIERPLRRPEQYRRAIGSQVAVKLLPTVEGERRLQGLLVAADDETITLETDAPAAPSAGPSGPDGPSGGPSGAGEAGGGRRTIALGTVDRARTVFDWGRPTGGPKGRPAGGPKGRPNARSEARSNGSRPAAQGGRAR